MSDPPRRPPPGPGAPVRRASPPAAPAPSAPPRRASMPVAPVIPSSEPPRRASIPVAPGAPVITSSEPPRRASMPVAPGAPVITSSEPPRRASMPAAPGAPVVTSSEPPRRPSLAPEGDEAALSQRAQAPGRLVYATYRLLKACLLHSDANQTVQALVPGVLGAVGEVCAASGIDAATILFGGEMVLVNRRLLKASRETYALARELGTLLAGCDVNEVAFEQGVRGADVLHFARTIADAHRSRAAAKKLAGEHFGGIRLRKVATDDSAVRLENDSALARLVRTYASSIVILRAFHADLAAGKLALTPRVKRIAQKLTAHAADDARLLVALAAAPIAGADPAAVSVSTASLAVLMARHLTDDKVVLAGIGMAGLVLDAGRVRLVAHGARIGPDGDLDDAAAEREAASAALVLTAIGRLHPQAVTRTVVVFEALSVLRGARSLDQVSPHAAVLATAAAFNEARRAASADAPVTLADAITLLTAQAPDGAGRFYVHLLVRALGLFPAGALVQLNTGEIAIVMGAPELPLEFARPPVRVLADARGKPIEPPLDVDLAAPRRPGQPLRFVQRSLAID